MSLSLTEVEFIHRHREEIAALSARVGLSKATALSDAEYARTALGEYGRAALEVIQARRAGAGKFPDTWLADHDAAQQATPAPVAAERARRLARHAGVVHDVTCSIGTEGHAYHRAGLDYLGSDVDAARARMAAHNLPGALILRADALAPSSSADVIVADPARRAGGRRISDPARLLPPLPALVAAYPGRNLAVKCAPGIDYSEWEGLVSVSSVAGAVKEACLYSPGLAEGVRREAVMVGPRGIDRLTDEGVVGRDTSEVGADAPGRYIIDPDGAVVRAGLVRHYAAREGLWMLDERIAYLTGDRLPRGRSGFQFREMVPLKKARAALKKHDAGAVEILVRGVDVDPDALRKQWKLKGANPMAVVCTRIGRQGVALICGPRTTEA
ncbi:MULTISPECIES: THUMP-like domain-containing protein [unclassified Corynebacterium]|uniref:THUMP-like domain-containing protein n=1 Tax=unclassified Corynebacterium TaxID=2624378 RepID=UPI0029C9B673|nr:MULTISPECIES: SAM-dependent methyltransferase [unclassified Corynebacterium]WPF67025.1 SAM-dependent methyltransferase [Corynebacterium sp. 22KM0430]WPF69513.1 SAM-dependent methyltransferase [Corynebacterium sp. 21KM1197]